MQLRLSRGVSSENGGALGVDVNSDRIPPHRRVVKVTLKWISTVQSFRLF